MRFLTRSLIGLALLGLTLGLIGYGVLNLQSALADRAAREAAPRSERERVYAAPVQRITPQEITPKLIAYGELRSLRELELRAPTSGWIEEAHPAFREGRSIAAGDVVVRIDPADAETQLATARADLEDAENELIDAERAYLLAQDELASATSQADLRSQALARQIDLRDRGFGSDASVETAALAEAAINQTVFSRRQAVADAEARIEQAGTDLSRRRIDLAEAERLLSETVVRAPFDGAFTEVVAETGTRVAENERLATLIDPDLLEASFRIASAQYLRLLDDRGVLLPTEVTVSLDVQGSQIVTQGTLTGVAAQVADGQTGRQLFATLATSRGFQPGDFVTITVSEPPLANVAQLPASALTPDSYVMVLGEDDRLRQMQVSLLRRIGDEVLIDAAALDGLEIVTQLTPLLGAGIKIRPIRPLAETAQAAPGDQASAVPMITLDAARRAELVSIVEASTQLQQPAKDRFLVRLRAEQVPAELITRIEAREGG
ncbi:efflux RND transporter periplasmic adaptor subunit [Tropicimonas sp. S265A]|uniref:efflux RND transporter periplasmic adaptor subunit n=1 Tax=Tropicimonas sp. S265A TaxID=3415134 RepID=UPI003C7B765E